MIAKVIRWIINIVVTLTCKTHLDGIEKIPDSGGCIITANHLGWLDAFLVYRFIQREDIIMCVAEKYRKYAVYRFAVKTLNAVWIERFDVDFSALRQILKRLYEGGIFIIAPEGTRSSTESLDTGKPGAAYLASKAKVPILPVSLTGTEDRIVLLNLKKMKRSPVTISIGDPFTIPALPRGKQGEALQHYTDEIMCHIAALLPPNYRGVYGKHPRLKELLSGL